MERMPKCYECELELDDDDVWYNSDFTTGDCETTKWKCPNCDTVNLTTAIVVTTFETEKFDEEIHDEPDEEWRQ